MPLGCSPWSACRRVAVPASSVKTVFWPQTLAQLPRRASAADSLLLQAAMIVPAGLISSRLGCAGNANSTAAQQHSSKPLQVAQQSVGSECYGKRHLTFKNRTTLRGPLADILEGLRGKGYFCCASAVASHFRHLTAQRAVCPCWALCRPYIRPQVNFIFYYLFFYKGWQIYSGHGSI